MMQSRLRTPATLGLAVLSSAVTSGCSAPPWAGAGARPADQATLPSPTARIAQLDFGRHAAFATCLTPSCPAVTPKTLASDLPSSLPVRRPAEPGPLLELGEASVAVEPGPRSQPEPVHPVQPISGAATMPQQVTAHFAFGSASLSPTARASIDQATGGMPAAQRIVVRGRTDNIGPNQVNEVLALARAIAVQQHLRVHHPLLAPALVLDARGSCCFTASNETPQGRAQNRRVEVVFDRQTADP